MNNLGTIGEAKVLTYFVERGYNVFTQFDGKAPFDLVIYKEGTLKRVSVKSTAYCNLARTPKCWTVELKSTRLNRTKTVIRKFDNSTCDLLAVYIQPEDRVEVFDSKDIKATCALTIRKGPVSGDQCGLNPQAP